MALQAFVAQIPVGEVKRPVPGQWGFRLKEAREVGRAGTPRRVMEEAKSGLEPHRTRGGFAQGEIVEQERVNGVTAAVCRTQDAYLNAPVGRKVVFAVKFQNIGPVPEPGPAADHKGRAFILHPAVVGGEK